METAGRLAAEALLSKFPKHTFHILVGPGNNGGDGLVIARLLRDAGRIVSVSALGGNKHSELRQTQEKIFVANGGHFAKDGIGDVVIDAVFGVGFRPPVPEDVKAELQRIMPLAKHCVAIDVPSGSDPDDGGAELLFKPTLTLTFGAPKPLLALNPELTYEVLQPGFPRRALSTATTTNGYVIYDHEAGLKQNPWASLSASAHKFQRGHVLVVGGSEGKFGAPLLAATAALRAGAGWVSVSLPTGADKTSHLPDLTFEDLWHKAKLDSTKFSEFVTSRHVKAVVIGPGTMEKPWDKKLLERCAELNRAGVFFVFDAGALTELLPEISGFVPERTLLTPHPGEWARLAGKHALPDPRNFANLAALKQAHCTILYKSARPILLDNTPTAKVAICGDNGLSRAGTGDVLAGLAAAHGAIGCDAGTSALRAYALLCQTLAKLRSRKPHFGDGILASDLALGL
jgi:NAD(P)H-hydrate epimerase